VHERDSLVHAVGDVDALTRHLTLLDEDRERLAEMRAACLAGAPALTWEAAGRQLLEVYERSASHDAPTQEAVVSVR
jgi:glycosyltransferase involved in cell wall biosynthesis